MIVLVLNCGSSSIKYQLLDMTDPAHEVLKAVGVVERIGQDEGVLTHKPNDKGKYKFTEKIPNHEVGIELIMDALVSKAHGVINDVLNIDAVGHRVAHGGEYFSKSELIDDIVKEKIAKLCDLAPLHNPAHLAGIESMEKLLPNVPQVAVFDTSFHQTMKPEAFLYALPYEYYLKHKIRKYGFHGTSHKYVAEEGCKLVSRDFSNSKIITCHLGNGASVCAIKNGESVETSMGFTPVEGLIMGTRVGNLDLGALLYIMEKEKLDIKQTNELINKKSGMEGISGVSCDMRDIEYEAWEKGNPRAKTAMYMYYHRVRSYIGSYAAQMGGVDIIIFTGGVGENGPLTRQRICEGLEFMGVDFSHEANDGIKGELKEISKPGSKVKVLVVPTNEEKVIATDTVNVIQKADI